MLGMALRQWSADGVDAPAVGQRNRTPTRRGIQRKQRRGLQRLRPDRLAALFSNDLTQRLALFGRQARRDHSGAWRLIGRRPRRLRRLALFTPMLVHLAPKRRAIRRLAELMRGTRLRGRGAQRKHQRQRQAARP